MSVFRPSARVKDPTGREWEIYAFRIRLRERGPLDPWVSDSSFDPRLSVFGLPFLFAAAIVRGLVRLFVDIPLACVRALQTDEWSVEAVSWAPFRNRYLWTTTREYLGQTLAQVEGGLARGDTIPRPRNARFVREN